MPQAAPATQTLDTIRAIMRRDLKLGDGVELPDEMPLIGGDLDLDSLDVLLMLTSLEKEFGFKITSETIDRSAFADIRTLALYIEQRRAAGGGGTDSQIVDPRSLLVRLPHGEPFRFVSSLTKVSPGVDGEGVWRVTGREDFFRGHFPNNPLVPGVLIAEALAQLSGLVGSSAGTGAEGRLASVEVRFREPVSPPADVVLRSKLAGTMGSLKRFDVEARLGERVVAEGSLALSVGR